MTAATVTHEHGEVDLLYAETRDIRLLGFMCFIATDLVLFSSFIFAYLYLRNTAQAWPPAGVPHLEIAFAALNSVVLFGSGATMHYALENYKHGNFNRYAGFMIATILLGAFFVGGQGYEYSNLIYNEHVTWAGSGIFGAAFFTLTGLHGLHVSLGVIFLGILLLQSIHGIYTKEKHFGLTAGTLYWHFVDVIWVLLFSIFYLI